MTLLVDTNVLVGLVDPRDEHHAIAMEDLQSLRGKPMYATTSVLVEACALLPARHRRAQLFRVIQQVPFGSPPLSPARDLRAEIFRWLDQYAEHNPDYADAELAVLSGMDRKVRIWTYDSEFASIWRRPDGTRIPLAIRR